jgi:hypothetical protein
VLTLIGQVEGPTRTTTAASSVAGSAVSSHANMRSLMDDSIITNETHSSTKSTATLNGAPTGSIVSGHTFPNLIAHHKLGSIKETRTSEYIDYEIYLGEELKNGTVTLEMAGYNTLVVKVNSSDWDTSGDYNLELKRQIKLPIGSDSQHTQHGVDPSSALLLIKVPFK